MNSTPLDPGTLLDSGMPAARADLATHHAAMLTAESAISPEVITERGYRTLLHPDDLRDLGFSKAQARTAPALAIPLWDVHGHQTGWQIRPDSPRLVGEKLAKYETPKGSRLTLDVHPRCQPDLGNPSVDLWVTEGVKKGDALVSQGACTIALMGGVWGFRGTNEHGGKVILPDWRHVALNGRQVYVVFDSDLATKPGVQKALNALYTFLRSEQAIPACVEWPAASQQQKMGVDDYFAQGHTLQDLLALVPPVGPLPLSPPSSRNGSAPVPIEMLLAKNLAPLQILANVLRVLEGHPAWKQALGFDALLNDVVFLQRPPYLAGADPWTTRPATENDYNEFAAWLQNTYGLHVGKTLAGDALTTYAFRFPFHAIRDYLDKLDWDKKPRLNTWLPTYCNVPNTPYAQAVGSKTFLAGVARVYEPGCKVDTMTILEGPQGFGKSTTWNILAGEAWFTDWLPDVHDKEAAQTLCGKWFVEFGELSAFQRSEVEPVKRFVSGKTDHYRPSYGRKAQTFPRQNIFVASTNADHYFKDDTGNRRYWPVKVEGHCAIDALRQDRDQLWAEAVARYRQGEKWYMTPEQEQWAAAEQYARLELDDWEDTVLEYVKGSHHHSNDGALCYVTTRDIFVEGFHIDNPLYLTQANTKRIASILRRNGWKRRTVWNEDNSKQFKAFTIEPGPLWAEMENPVTGNKGENEDTGNSKSPSNDASVTRVTCVTCLLCIREGEKDEKDENAEIIPERPKCSTDFPGSTGNTGNTGNKGQDAACHEKTTGNKDAVRTGNRRNGVTGPTSATLRPDEARCPSCGLPACQPHAKYGRVCMRCQWCERPMTGV